VFQGARYGSGVVLDHRDVSLCGGIGRAAALLPIADAAEREPEALGELGLAELQALAQEADAPTEYAAL
jgi:hypothetical protein